MDQPNLVTNSTYGSDEDEITLIDIILDIAKHKKLIFWFPVAIASIAAVISMVLPPVFRATATLLPPQQSQSGATALLSQLGGTAGALAGAAGIKNSSDLYVGMLKSRTIADAIVSRFSLVKVYEVESPEKARIKLQSNTSFTSGKDGLINIAVEHDERTTVAQLANAYTEELIRLSRTLALTQSAQRRLFYEQQLASTKENLAIAELALQRGLASSGVVSVDSQSKAIVETIARVRAQISAKEVQLNSMRAFMTPENSSFKRIQEELISLKTELRRLENGSGGDAIGGTSPAGLANIKVLRDVKYHQMLYEILGKQYEMARLDEAQEAAVIQVLDPAVAPEKKFKPQRMIIVVLAGLLAFIAALVCAISIESFKRYKLRPGANVKFNELASRIEK